MNELLEVDFVIVRKKQDEAGQPTSLVGRVVENGRLREQSLELSVSQVIDYVAQGGTFYTGLEENSGIDLGGKLKVIDEDERVRLRTVEGTEEKYHLSSLPADCPDKSG